MSCIAAATEDDEEDESGDITDILDSVFAVEGILLLLLPGGPETVGMFIGAADASFDDRLLLEAHPEAVPVPCGWQRELGAGDGGGVGPLRIENLENHIILSFLLSVYKCAYQ